MKRSTLVFMLLLAICTAFTGCATKSEVETLEMQARRDREEARKLLRQMEQEFNTRLETSSSPVREKQADIWVELNALRTDLAMLQGQVDDLSLQLDQLSGGEDSTTSLPALALDMKAVKFALEHQLAIDLGKIRQQVAPKGDAAARAARGTAQAAEPMTPSSTDPEQQAEQAIVQAEQGAQDPSASKATPATNTGETVAPKAEPAQALYDKAYAAFGERNYEQARTLWAEFVTAFPDHFLVPNAVFWQGECYYQLQDYKRAVLAYQDVIKKYPKSSKFKYALLKQGISLYKLDRADLGKVVLQDLVDKYPSTPEAARAKQFMQTE